MFACMISSVFFVVCFITGCILNHWLLSCFEIFTLSLKPQNVSCTLSHSCATQVFAAFNIITEQQRIQNLVFENVTINVTSFSY